MWVNLDMEHPWIQKTLTYVRGTPPAFGYDMRKLDPEVSVCVQLCMQLDFMIVRSSSNKCILMVKLNCARRKRFMVSLNVILIGEPLAALHPLTTSKRGIHLVSSVIPLLCIVSSKLCTASRSCLPYIQVQSLHAISFLDRL